LAAFQFVFLKESGRESRRVSGSQAIFLENSFLCGIPSPSGEDFVKKWVVEKIK
jgi:hypothetical protein